MQARGRPHRQTTEIRSGSDQHPGHALETGDHRREPHREWREIARQKREDAAAEQVDIAKGVPRILAQLRLVETQLRQLGPQQVAVDALVRRQDLVG